MVVTKRALLALFAKAAGLASLILSASYQIIKLQLGVVKLRGAMGHDDGDGDDDDDEDDDDIDDGDSYT